MNDIITSGPTLDTMLTELAALGMRGARVVVRMMEIEQDAANVIAEWLPESKFSMLTDEAVWAGHCVDAVETQL